MYIACAVSLLEKDMNSLFEQDEKKRIEELGGSVTYTQGNWRVNGNISVSRAIGKDFN